VSVCVDGIETFLMSAQGDFGSFIASRVPGKIRRATPSSWVKVVARVDVSAFGNIYDISRTRN
jgi:hypothetical protein